jgi:hypothetical protein
MAQVIADGRGAWSVKVWLTSNHTVMVRIPRDVENLPTAQGKADRLACKTFDHRCDEGCGEWTWACDPTVDPTD